MCDADGVETHLPSVATEASIVDHVLCDLLRSACLDEGLYDLARAERGVDADDGVVAVRGDGGCCGSGSFLLCGEAEQCHAIHFVGFDDALIAKRLDVGGDCALCEASYFGDVDDCYVTVLDCVDDCLLVVGQFDHVCLLLLCC